MANQNHTPKFLLAFDREFNQEFVIHTQSPALLARVDEFTGEPLPFQELIKLGYNIASRTNAIDGKYWVLQLVNELEKRPTTQESADDMAAVMRRMGDWYFSVKKERVTK